MKNETINLQRRGFFSSVFRSDYNGVPGKEALTEQRNALHKFTELPSKPINNLDDNSLQEIYYTLCGHSRRSFALTSLKVLFTSIAGYNAFQAVSLIEGNEGKNPEEQKEHNRAGNGIVFYGTVAVGSWLARSFFSNKQIPVEEVRDRTRKNIEMAAYYATVAVLPKTQSTSLDVK